MPSKPLDDLAGPKQATLLRPLEGETNTSPLIWRGDPPFHPQCKMEQKGCWNCSDSLRTLFGFACGFKVPRNPIPMFQASVYWKTHESGWSTSKARHPSATRRREMNIAEPWMRHVLQKGNDSFVCSILRVLGLGLVSSGNDKGVHFQTGLLEESTL